MTDDEGGNLHSLSEGGHYMPRIYWLGLAAILIKSELSTEHNAAMIC